MGKGKPTPRATGALWTRENLAWLAGLLEGEGAFLITRRPHATAFRISANMTDGDVIRRVAEIAGCGRIVGPVEQKNPKHKPFYRWNVDRRRDAYALCVALYPFMGQRRRARIKEIAEAYRTTGIAGWSHGSRRGYDWGCRCAACRAVNAARARAQRSRRRERKVA